MPLFTTYRWLLQKHYVMESRADEVHRVRAEDGVRVAVKRFRPAGEVERRTPVLCVPGLGADSHNYDAPLPAGLGPYLAAQGFDTWAVDLRGTGLSPVHGKQWRSITFDDFVQKDLPAVVEHVCAQSGSPDLLWVGHSMGGQLLYATLGTGRGARVKAGVAIASPIGFPTRWQVAPIFEPVAFLGERITGLHAGTLLRFFAPLMLRTRDPWNERFIELDQIDPSYARRLMFHAVQDIPRDLALQFRDWVHNDAFRSADRSVDYRARLAGVRTPIQLLIAPKDRLGVPDAARRALDLLEDVEVVTCCTKDGFSADFGHIDVVFGKHAPTEVYPKIAGFLAKHDAASSATTTKRAGRLHVVR
jgi:pimeloyl-ACP methyl ester carboxylesterase